MPTPSSDDDPYIMMVQTIMNLAVEDAQGRCGHPGNRAPAQIAVEARVWLQDDRELTDLLELAGYDAAPVLRRVQQMFPADTARSRT